MFAAVRVSPSNYPGSNHSGNLIPFVYYKGRIFQF